MCVCLSIIHHMYQYRQRNPKRNIGTRSVVLELSSPFRTFYRKGCVCVCARVRLGFFLSSYFFCYIDDLTKVSLTKIYLLSLFCYHQNIKFIITISDGSSGDDSSSSSSSTVVVVFVLLLSLLKLSPGNIRTSTSVDFNWRLQ